MDAKIYTGPDGKKYVETKEAAPKYSRAVEGRPYLCDKGTPRERVVVDNGVGEFYESVPILRLATPEEIAGAEKKMCPAGCGADYGAHASHQGCPWFKALLKKSDLDSTADFPLCSAYADAHWKEFVKYEVGVDLGKEPSKSAGVHLTPESVGKAYRTRGGWKAVVRERMGRPFVVEHMHSTMNSIGISKWLHGEDGTCDYAAKDSDRNLISEWDEKAEAAGGEPAARASVGSSEPAGVHAPESDKSSAKPAAQPPSDPAAFYQWLWGFPRPFEVGVPDPVVHQQCACCSATHVKFAGRLPLAILKKRCPECGGTGLHTGGGR